MGLFDFLKKKPADEDVKPQPSVEQSQPSTPAKTPYLGDLEKTQRIGQLVQTPHTERDDAWQQAFLENALQASFRCGDPQIITGPDGFPYFQLFLPEPNQPFQCFVIEHMKDDFLLSSGYGVVINPTQAQPDWVFSYGDIVNLHINQAFYTTGKTLFSKNAQQDEVIKENEEVLTGQPAESILPAATRQVLSQFLKAQGVVEPKVLLMQRSNPQTKEMTQDIVLNTTPENFESEEKYRAVMQSIRWFLPNHYSYAGMSEKTLSNFMPL
ncbi:MAG: hypothetical protein WBP13_03315 [Methylophilaceae bacterium]